MNEEDILDQIELSDFEEIQEDEAGEDETPTLASPEWTDYVLSFLTPDEKINGKPRTDGLVRIARFLGLNFDCGVQVHCVNEGYAAVTCQIVLEHGMSGNTTKYVGSAEVHAGNTDPPFHKYPLATAETRAIGRAVKRMLCISVTTAEEISNVASLKATKKTTPSKPKTRLITSTQIKLIDNLCKKLNVSVPDAVCSVAGNHQKINDLGYDEAYKVTETLDGWSRQTDDSDYANLNAYKSNWSDEFYVS